jgi:hypothetical protein
MPLQSEGPKGSVLARLGGRLWALTVVFDRLLVWEIRYPTGPAGELPMIKPTEREKMVVRNHRSDWP